MDISLSLRVKDAFSVLTKGRESLVSGNSEWNDTDSYSIEHDTTPYENWSWFWRAYKSNALIFGCVNRLSRALTNYDILAKDEDTDIDDERSTLEEFFDKINKRQSMIDLSQFAMKQILVQGYAAIEIIKEDELPIELVNIEGEVKPKRNREGIIEFTQKMGGKNKKLNGENIIWIPNCAESTIHSHSPLQTIIQEVVTDYYSLVYNKAFYHRGSQIGLHFKLPGANVKELKIREAYIRQQITGAKKAFGNLFTDENTEISKITLSNKDMESQELIQTIADRIMCVYGVPPMKLGMVKTGKLANPKEQLAMFADSVQEWERPIEYAINTSLIPLFEFPDRVYFQFKHDDTPKREIEAEIGLKEAQRDAFLIQNGIMTTNEIRGLRGLPEIEIDEVRE